jgi:heme/copper-type cytochrome/quinol oxidase subunit 2
MVVNQPQCSSLLLNSTSISCVWDDNFKICVSYQVSNNDDSNKLRINILITLIFIIFLLLVLMFIIIMICVIKKRWNKSEKKKQIQINGKYVNI